MPKLTLWEKKALAQLRKLDVDQRGIQLCAIDRAVLTNEIIMQASGLDKVRPPPAYRVTEMYGEPPGVSWEFDRDGA